MRIQLLPMLVLIVLFGGCVGNTFSDRDIDNPKPVELPISSVDEAIHYSLSLDQVKSELDQQLEGNMAQYNKYDWWVKSNRLNPENYDGKEVWAVNWFKGPGECQSPHGCQILIASDGTVVSDLHCSDGWNCK